MLYRLVSWTIMPVARWRTRRVLGLEHVPLTGPVIFAANHASWVDPVIIGSALYPVLKRPLSYVAASGKYRLLGGLAIDQVDRSGVINQALRKLERGLPVGIFPGGNVKNGETLPRAKTGVARLAHWSGAPVIPVGVRNVGGVRPLPTIWDFLKHRRAELLFGEPLVFPRLPEGDIDPARLQATADGIMIAIGRLVGKTYPYAILHPPTHSDALVSAPRAD